MPKKLEGHPSSATIRAQLKEIDLPVLVAFSAGKDSIATSLALKEAGLKTHLVYLYAIPGKEPGTTLGFIEDTLSDLEDSLGQTIHRYPHISFWRKMNSFMFQPPERLSIIEAAHMPEPDYVDMWDAIKRDLGIPEKSYTADGVKASDSVARRISVMRFGMMKPHLRKCSPIGDWLKADVMEIMDRHGIELPIDYKWFGRSFDGISYSFLKPISENAPEDYQRILDWFPLAELELFRYDQIGQQ